MIEYIIVLKDVINVKVIFLDFDGVINDNIFGKFSYVEEKFLLLLKEIIDKTGAKIVVSSAKKNELFDDYTGDLKDSKVYKNYFVPIINFGLDIYDITPYVKTDGAQDREAEIIEYLNAHPEIEEFVIIEDDNIIFSLIDHQVLIEYCDGLSSEHVDAAIRILRGELGFYPPSVDISEPLDDRFQRILKYRNKVS